MLLCFALVCDYLLLYKQIIRSKQNHNKCTGHPKHLYLMTLPHLKHPFFLSNTKGDVSENVYAAWHSSKRFLWCSMEDRKSCRYEMTWSWVNTDRIYFLRWTIPLIRQRKHKGALNYDLTFIGSIIKLCCRKNGKKVRTSGSASWLPSFVLRVSFSALTYSFENMNILIHKPTPRLSQLNETTRVDVCAEWRL